MSNKSAEAPRGLPLVDLLEPATIRLIPTAYIDEPAMQPLADDDIGLAILEDLEQATSLRQDADFPLPAGVQKSELLTPAFGYGWSYVNAAFCYTRPTGGRFNDANRGAWYASLGHQPASTSTAEVGHHLTQELANIGVFRNFTTYRELLAGFIGPFVDLRGQADADYLHPEISTGHPAGQLLAHELRAAGLNGVIYPSVRRKGGTCLAAFRTTLVQNIRQGETWELQWSGSPEFKARRVAA